MVDVGIDLLGMLLYSYLNLYNISLRNATCFNIRFNINMDPKLFLSPPTGRLTISYVNINMDPKLFYSVR